MAPSERPLRVTVVNDDRPFLELMSAALSDFAGAAVTPIIGSDAARELILHSGPDPLTGYEADELVGRLMAWHCAHPT